MDVGSNGPCHMKQVSDLICTSLLQLTEVPLYRRAKTCGPSANDILRSD